MVVLDGLEVAQEGPAGGEFGRLLDGVLREVLTGWCQQEHAGLAVLTSRFPFADLDQPGRPRRELASRVIDAVRRGCCAAALTSCGTT